MNFPFHFPKVRRDIYCPARSITGSTGSVIWMAVHRWVPLIPAKYQALCREAIRRSIIALFLQGPILLSFVQEIIFRTVLRPKTPIRRTSLVILSVLLTGAQALV